MQVFTFFTNTAKPVKGWPNLTYHTFCEFFDVCLSREHTLIKFGPNRWHRTENPVNLSACILLVLVSAPLAAEELEMQRYCASLFAPDPAPSNPASTSSSSTSSNQHEHPAKSQLSMVELEQVRMGYFNQCLLSHIIRQVPVCNSKLTSLLVLSQW